MTWQENLFQNLLTAGILLSIVVMVYCKIAKKTLGELILEIKEAMSTPIEE